jgi:hypothetical protein
MVERITRNFNGRRLTGAVFLDVVKAVDTVWIDAPSTNKTLLNFPSYLNHTISSYLPGSGVRNVFPDGHIISSRHTDWVGSGWVDTPVLTPM